MRKLLYLLSFSVICLNCTQNDETEKYQTDRNKIINVRDSIKEIKIEEVYISNVARAHIVDNYLIIEDSKPEDKHLHFFDKNNFNYVTSAITRGRGPGEITVIGHVEYDNKQRLLYITDHGKKAIFSYPLDSVLANPTYMPEVKVNLNAGYAPWSYI